jgi:hypothetical protein
LRLNKKRVCFGREVCLFGRLFCFGGVRIILIVDQRKMGIRAVYQ